MNKLMNRYDSLSEGDSARLVEAVSAAVALIDIDQRGDESLWCTGGFGISRMDSQSQAFVKDAVMEARKVRQRLDSGHRTDSVDRLDASGYPVEALTFYEEPIEARYQKTPYADPGLLTIRTLNRPGVEFIKSLVVSDRDATGWQYEGQTPSTTGTVMSDTTEVSYRTVSMTKQVNYTNRELEVYTEAVRNGNPFRVVNLVQRRLTVGLEQSLREELNSVHAFGKASIGLYGLHNFYGTNTYSSSIAIDPLTTTAEQIQEILRRAVTQFQVQNGEMVSPNLAMMTLDLVNVMRSRMMGTSGSVSVLDWFLRTYPSIGNGFGVINTPEMRRAGRGGTPAIHLAYLDGSTRAVLTRGLHQVAPPMYVNGAWSVPFEARSSGVHIDYPQQHLSVGTTL